MSVSYFTFGAFAWLSLAGLEGLKIPKFSASAGRNFPCFEPKVANCLSGAAARLNRNAIANHRVHGDECWQRSRRSMALHCSFSLSKRQVTVFGRLLRLLCDQSSRPRGNVRFAVLKERSFSLIMHLEQSHIGSLTSTAAAWLPIFSRRFRNISREVCLADRLHTRASTFPSRISRSVRDTTRCG